MSRNLTRKALEKQTAKFRKTYDTNCIMLKNQRLEGKNTIDPDKTAHYEQSHLDLQYLQIQLLLCLTLYGFKERCIHTALVNSLYPHNPDAVHSRLPVMFDKLDDMKENERQITMTMLYNISQKHPEVTVLVSITSTVKPELVNTHYALFSSPEPKAYR